MPQHTYITPGLFYKVTLKVTNTCGEVSIQSFRLNQIGEEEYLLNTSVEVYPNPASDFVNVKWNIKDLNVERISIIDVTGRLVKSFKNTDDSEGELTLDINSISSGLYFIQIHTKGKTLKYMLVKE